MDIHQSILEIKKALEWWEAGLINKMEFYSMIRKAGGMDESNSITIQSHCSSSLLADSGVRVIEREYKKPTQEEWAKTMALIAEVKEEIKRV